MKTTKIIYWVSTGLLTLLMLFSASMYLFKHELAATAFSALGYPLFIIYPLAIAKILGLVTIWTKKVNTLTEWAYAGFFFNTLLAASSHISVGDGEFGGALIGMILVLVSYYSYKKLSSPVEA